MASLFPYFTILINTKAVNKMTNIFLL
jgi:hypothetical protein